MEHMQPKLLYADYRIRTFVPGLGTARIEANMPWMNIMLHGSSEYMFNEAPLVLKESHIAYFRPGDTVGRNPQNTDVRYISLRFDSRGYDYEIDTVTPIGSERMYTLISLFHEYCFGGDMTDSCIVCGNDVLDIILRELESVCKNKEVNKRVTQIRTFIYTNYMNEISTVDIAKELFLNPSYCNTLFKENTGESISDFITRVRIDHASAKLAFSNMSIKDIAYESGYRDVFYFSRQFNRKKGCSPSEYRKVMKK